jgi:hypothetical protein
MDFFAVFQFFSENVELTEAQRRLELGVVLVTGALLLCALVLLLRRKIKLAKRRRAETEKENANR